MSGAARIRLATAADGAALAAIYAPAVDGRATSFELTAPDADEMARRVERLTARTPWLVLERDARVLGYAYASPHRDRPAYQWSVEVSAYVHADAHRGGVGRALYTSLFALLALQGFRNAYAGITLPNDASEGMHRALGFTPVGVFRGVGYKLGAWHDVVWLERAIAPHDVEPAPPVPLPELRDAAARQAAMDAGLACLRPDAAQ
ncbi:GNAT family N-acetyltransferase [Roseisolibacter agri]|uniref:N-acetyltransferase n=1 Tax=Roseisolibacter agri TaxID=2014610 RepID=A0AA37V773_9BACT|nr:GNAT family N-acetyltransferase [Roseisolibacter agri]GLC26231.1 N-acetyltransferase [Roseisolibacter agri]